MPQQQYLNPPSFLQPTAPSGAHWNLHSVDKWHETLSAYTLWGLTASLVAVALRFAFGRLDGTFGLTSNGWIPAIGLILLQGSVLGAVLLRRLWVRIPLGIVALLLLLGFGYLPGGAWFMSAPIATALLLLFRGTEHAALRTIAMVGAAYAASCTLPGHVLVSPVLYWLCTLTGAATFLLALAMMINRVRARDAWGVFLITSSVTVAAGGVLNFFGGVASAMAADTGSVTFAVFGLSMIGSKPSDVVTAGILPAILLILGLVKVFQQPGGAPDHQRSTAKSTLGTVLMVLTLAAAPAIIGLASDDLGALASIPADFAFPIVWVVSLLVWRAANRDFQTSRMPFYALTTAHQVAVLLLIAAPVLRGVLAWLDVIVDPSAHAQWFS